MLPSQFTQGSPGDMFIYRNPGNIVPSNELTTKGPNGSTGEPAALELACLVCGVDDVVVCGHSDCKAMIALSNLSASGLDP